jgi:predicted nucleotidyltransferase component of viral defense system
MGLVEKKTKIAKSEYAERAERIKRLALIAMVSDDSLMNRLVLKGGNAMDLILGVGARASTDLDFSMSGELSPDEVMGFRQKVNGLLSQAFTPEGFTVLDINFEVVPPRDRATDPELFFWGGYQIDFKVIESERAEELQGDIEKLRKEAFRLGDGGSTKFSIEISKYEYCEPKEAKEIEGYRVYVYSPTMIVAEKLRAICQKTDEYAQIVHTKSQGERARDFFDVYVLITRFNIDLTTAENLFLIKAVFEAKKVPLSILAGIEQYKERHRAGFAAVRASVKPGIKVEEDFDFYFNYLVQKVAELHSLWEI